MATPGIMNTLVRQLPEDGDVVVREERRDGLPVYVLHVPPGPDQILIRPQDEAIARALAFARRRQVRAWLGAEGSPFALLEDFRSTLWSVCRGARPHTLLIGPYEYAQTVIARLLRHLHAPLVHWRPRTRVEPPQTADTLVVWDVEVLDRTQQALLLAWMDRHASAAQVISVAKSPVFPLVLRGEFVEALYYRLNTVCLTLSNDRDVSF